MTVHTVHDFAVADLFPDIPDIPAPLFVHLRVVCLRHAAAVVLAVLVGDRAHAAARLGVTRLYLSG